MDHDGQLSALLTEFAHILPTDFSVQAILDRLVESIVDLLPVSAAGVTLLAPGRAPHHTAASDDTALLYERLQSDLGQGPRGTAYDSGEAVSCPDLSLESRFPAFTRAAADAGLSAVFAFPLRHDGCRLGVLNLYRETSGMLAQRDMASAQTLADVTAAYVLNAQARDASRQAVERFRDSAQRDPLTGLANRLLLHQRLEHAAQRARRSHTTAAVLFIDLDRFKQVNDAYGHQVGDELLVAVARRLTEHVRPGDTLARVSGDEFVVLCEDLSGEADIDALATRIHAELSRPFELSRQQVTISASVGMAYAGPGEAVSNQLVVDADIAMYQAKRRRGSGHQVLDLREVQRGDDRLSLGQELDEAFSQDGLDLAYQPIVSSDDGSIAGVEALLRWTHPQRGPIPTMDLVSIAEDNGLITRLGAWVLDRACSAHAGWLRAHPGLSMHIAVNVSPRQLLAPGFAESVDQALRRTGTAPRDLVLEMADGIFVGDPERAVTVLADVKGLGVRIALDDFGSGLCSLNYLRTFDVDIIKIDRAFISVVAEDPTGAGIVAAVVQLAHLLDMLVVAEGVETPGQSDALARTGCDYRQGFLYARPMPAGAVMSLLGASSPVTGPQV